MTSQGPNNGSSFAGWTNSEYAQYSDDLRATTVMAPESNSSNLKVSAFGFSIPLDATINGIVLEIERHANWAVCIKDKFVFLMKDGTTGIGTDHADTGTWWLQNVDAYATYGSPTDLWGLTWTPAEVNANTFGEKNSVRNYSSGSRTAYVDHIRITVYYTVAGPNPPTVTTQAATGVQATQVTGNGTITATGGANATVRGFKYGKTQTDTWDVHETGSFGVAAFSLIISGLDPATTYYYRAYATTPGGTGYGAYVAFTTANGPPVVTTQNATGVTSTSVTANGTIVATGGDNATIRGFKYGKTEIDTWDIHEDGDFGAAAFSLTISELEESMTYYYRAYATSPQGTSYGAYVSFTTGYSGSRPTTTAITANLKTVGGANYAGATVYFSTSFGSVSPASDVTDASGNAHTTLTAPATHGIAVVEAKWLGDGTVPACSAYCTVQVFCDPEVGDGEKGFQFYCQGIEYAHIAGRYTQNEVGAPNDFEVEIPEWISTLTPHGYATIYRLGVKEFQGILKNPVRTVSDSPRVTLKGPDISKLLADRVIDTKIYSGKTPQYIIDDLLDSFPCGILPGILGISSKSLTITIETESLAQAIPRICDLVNWKYRVNLDRTLDFAESFTSGIAQASFAEGVDLFRVDRDVNYSTVANRIRMKGSGITSTKQDGSKIKEQGLHEVPAFNKSISNQATLDAACQALLDMKKVEEETIPAEAVDEYDPGTFGPEDYITVTSATTGLSGTYQIRKIERNLIDPTFVKFDLVNRTKEWWELDEAYRRMTKDANV